MVETVNVLSRSEYSLSTICRRLFSITSYLSLGSCGITVILVKKRRNFFDIVSLRSRLSLTRSIDERTADAGDKNTSE